MQETDDFDFTSFLALQVSFDWKLVPSLQQAAGTSPNAPEVGTLRTTSPGSPLQALKLTPWVLINFYSFSIVTVDIISQQTVLFLVST
jgi:hypothetical protein